MGCVCVRRIRILRRGERGPFVQISFHCDRFKIPVRCGLYYICTVIYACSFLLCPTGWVGDDDDFDAVRLKCAHV